MQKHKEGNKTAVEGFISSKSDTKTDSVSELLDENGVRLVFNAASEQSCSENGTR